MKQMLIVLSLPMCLCAGADTPSDWPAVSGFVKSTVVGQRFPAASALSPLEGHHGYGLWQNTLRLRMFDQPQVWLNWEVAYEMSLVISQPEMFNAQGFIRSAPAAYRIQDFRGELTPDDTDDLQLLQNLDRLNLTLVFEWGDLILGRQPIAFGSARVANPTDVLAPFSYQDINRENRSGVDALRLRVPLGEMGEFDFGLVLGEGVREENSACFVRCRQRVMDSDVTAMAMGFRNHLMLGLDLVRDIGGATCWAEGAYTFANAFGQAITEEDYWRLSLGFQYLFAGDLSATLEYHYSSAGTRDYRNYIQNTLRLDAVSQTAAFADGQVYFLGKHYLAPSVSCEITPLVTVTASAMVNLADASTYLNGRLACSLSDENVLEAGFYYPLGRRSHRQGDQINTLSEFGLYAAMVYLGLRSYF